MNHLIESVIIRRLSSLLMSLPALLCLSSCGMVFDDLEPCPSGVRMRFVYDYNLEEADAFASQVDCLTLHLYDSDGNLVSTTSYFEDLTSDGNWRLDLDLAPGSYHAVAYGGIACEEASFAHIPEPSLGSHFTSISMQLKGSHVGDLLHDHFHGAVDFSVDAASEDFTEVTVRMTKTTNRFRILLKQLDNEPLDGRDFDFSITDDNKELDHANNPVKSGQNITYPAWTSGQVEDVAFGEISTSRLHLSTRPRLMVRDAKSGDTIIDLPLNTYLLMTKSEASGYGDQEYLDRCSQWNMTFFLDEDRKWADTRIIINGWTVRINDIGK
jgi:hypothetical protein